MGQFILVFAVKGAITLGASGKRLKGWKYVTVICQGKQLVGGCSRGQTYVTALDPDGLSCES